jgi:hypothetical protein
LNLGFWRNSNTRAAIASRESLLHRSQRLGTGKNDLLPPQENQSPQSLISECINLAQLIPRLDCGTQGKQLHFQANLSSIMPYGLFRSFLPGMFTI